MPESKMRKEAAEKLRLRRHENEVKVRSDKIRLTSPGGRNWVPPTFITVGLLGVAWLITYYIASPYIGFMITLGGWNVLIGMGLMAAAFVIATLWK